MGIGGPTAIASDTQAGAAIEVEEPSFIDAQYYTFCDDGVGNGGGGDGGSGTAGESIAVLLNSGIAPTIIP